MRICSLVGHVCVIISFTNTGLPLNVCAVARTYVDDISVI